MVDEERNETTEETTDAPPEEAAPPEDAPKEQEAQPEEEAPAEEQPAEGGDETPKEVDPPAAAADDEGSADGDGGGEDGSSDEEGLDWKTRKRLAKSRESGEAGPQRSPEKRASARAAARGTAGKSRSAYRRKQREKHQKGEGTAPVERESAGRKERQGYVVSDKADKTITVSIDVARRHRTYEKIVRTSNTLHAHDEANEAGEGDLVKIVETRPLSKTKRWRLVEVMEKAK